MHPLSQLDDALSERFTSATDAPAEPDWAGVERRARQLRSSQSSQRRTYVRSRVLVAALVLAAIAAAAPALGLDRAVIDFLRAEPAPETVRIDFGHWFDEVPPEDRRSGVAAEETRKVHTFTTESGNYELFVSPARDGFCYLISGSVGQCPDADFPVLSNGYREIPAPGDPSPEPNLISGVVKYAEVDRVVLSFENGERMNLPLVLVSEPIGAGFYLYELPRERWKRGLRPSRLTAYGLDNRVLGEAGIVYDEGR